MSKQLAFYFDESRCMSCNACSVACKDYNQLNPGLVSWRKQKTYENGYTFNPLSMGCNHCENPACVANCPFEAISKDDGGIVTIDRDKCQACGTCLEVCPFKASQIADDKQEPKKESSWSVEHPAQKCTMCIDRIAEGKKPICVTSCVGRALDLSSIDNIIKRYPDAVRLNKKDFPYAYKNDVEDNTSPCVFIKRKAALNVHQSKLYTGKS